VSPRRSVTIGIDGPSAQDAESFTVGAVTFESGTSAPHLVGIITLIYSAKPQLLGQVAATERLIERTASHYDSSECSSNGTYPNNLYGWGLPDPNNLYGWGLPDAGKALRP